MIKKFLTAFILLMAAWYAFLASRSLERTAKRIGDFDFNGIIEVATFGRESFFGPNPTSPVYIDGGGRILDMDPFFPKVIFGMASITGNLLFLLLFAGICFATMMLWFIALLGRLGESP